MGVVEFKSKDHCIPSDHQFMKILITFDVKHGLRRKSRLAAGGHLAHVLDDSVYASTVKIISFRILNVMSRSTHLKQLNHKFCFKLLAALIWHHPGKSIQTKGSEATQASATSSASCASNFKKKTKQDKIASRKIPTLINPFQLESCIPLPSCFSHKLPLMPWSAQNRFALI